MKILKYGKGYPKNICTCEHCKSELEYETSDVYWCDTRRFIEDGVYNVERHKLITCPVCNNAIELDTIIFVSVKPEIELLPKKRWWKR
jgi:hypothetical protein